jgi:hypothetical protein
MVIQESKYYHFEIKKKNRTFSMDILPPFVGRYDGRKLVKEK